MDLHDSEERCKSSETDFSCKAELGHDPFGLSPSSSTMGLWGNLSPSGSAHTTLSFVVGSIAFGLAAARFISQPQRLRE